MTLSLHNLGVQELGLQEYSERELCFLKITQTVFKMLEVKELKDLKFLLVTKTYLRNSLSIWNLLNLKNAKLLFDFTVLHRLFKNM